MAKNIFTVIYEKKVEVAKNIFKSFGEPHEKMADILTDDELAKAFDFFAASAESHDTDDDEVAMMLDYSQACIGDNLLSQKSIQRIKSEVQHDFFGPED